MHCRLSYSAAEKRFYMNKKFVISHDINSKNIKSGFLKIY